MGDFVVNLFGSFALVPLTVVFTSMIVLKIKGKSGGRWSRIWHWGIIIAVSSFHGSRRRYHCRHRPFDLPQRQGLPLLRRHVTAPNQRGKERRVKRVQMLPQYVLSARHPPC
ncbi:hypothetical protein PAHAL_5G049800 [Panicum hallii]|uniref:Uncharacterized protein n=1 Tax=Panicum hallii TaxID=206008 RepID=A0A2T8IJ03_9POAL|nr:hypothetical protein PAHAL_5G049800 [Panicum hallii]